MNPQPLRSPSVNIFLTTYLSITFMQRLPFDWKNPIGYIFALGLQCAGIYVMIHTAACCNSFIIGPCVMFIALAKDIKEDQERFQSVKQLELLMIKQKLSEFVDLHSNVKQLSRKGVDQQRNSSSINILFFYRLVEDFTEIYSNPILYLFLWSVLNICITLLMLQIELVSYIFQSLRISLSSFQITSISF